VVIRVFRHWSVAVGGALTLVVALAALVSLGWTPRSPTLIAVEEKLQGPSAARWFGTDQFGRDIASMLMVGARNSVAVGIVAVAIGLLPGTAVLRYFADRVLARVAGAEEIAWRDAVLASALLLALSFAPTLLRARGASRSRRRGPFGEVAEGRGAD
jgi:peptide/nickel transport system permease protein